MAVDSTPWFTGGGAQHSPEVARLLAYTSTGGAEGIVDPNSLKVAAQSVPGASVRVLPGAALILNRYAGGSQQTYALRNPTSTDVAIPATGSTGGRTDLIVARVLDPQYEGQPPANPLTFQYARIERVAGVPVGTKTAKQLNLGYPAVALARVTLPASTATVTAGMVTDLREVANPKKDDVLRARPLRSADVETLTSSNPAGEWFPNAGGEQRIDIPSWATRLQLSAKWLMVREPAGDASGQVWVEWGPFVSTGVRQYATEKYDFNSSKTSDVSRGHWEVADDMYIPAAIRGTEQVFVMKGWLRAAVPLAARPQLDATSGVAMHVRFLEVADPSTT